MALDISIRVSFFQLSLITILLGLTLSALWLSSIAAAMQFAASLAIIISGYDWLRQAFIVQSNSIVRLQSKAGDWWLTLSDGRTRKVWFTGAQVVLPWLVSLGFTDGRDQFGCAIFRDSLSATQHRQLRATVALQPPPENRFSIAIARLVGLLSKSRWYQYCVSRIR
ncbi:MAG: hypothetical protein ACJAYE_000878 [Candidatus Azotimanducaceae bacterium]